MLFPRVRVVCPFAVTQVSCTVTFDPAVEGPQLPHALNVFQYQLKGVSFLPKLPSGAYAQMPYEKITRSQYSAMVRPVPSPTSESILWLRSRPPFMGS